MGKKTKSSFVNLTNSRLKEQKERMSKIKIDGVCPFCLENLKKYHKSPIVKIGKFWIITKNDFPYKGSRVHFLAVYKKHIKHISEIEPISLRELLIFFKELSEENKIKGGTMLMRFGDTNYTGGTVKHLHAQLISGGKQSKNKKPIKIKIGHHK